MYRSTIKRVEETVLDLYVDSGKPLTVMEIREECKLSETIIRKVVTESTLVKLTHKQVPIMSRACPGRVHQMRTIDAFHPTRAWLVEIIKKTRREYEYFVTERSWRS